MNKNNWIFAYYQKIKDGSIVVNQWINRIMQYLVDGISEKQFFYDNKKANAAVDWIETHCFHTEGPLAPGPLKLELWQKAFVSAIFGIVDKDGLRVFRECLLLVARKNGKSLLAAAIERYIWFVDGGYGAKVYNVAPKLDQANIIYNNIWVMTTLDPEYQALKIKYSERDAHNKKTQDDAELPRLRQSDLFIPATNSTVKKVAFNYKSSDGYNPSAVIADEIAAWSGDAGIRAVLHGQNKPSTTTLRKFAPTQSTETEADLASNSMHGFHP
jgi:phage terminase large subunit-like protein